ncbi:S-Ena type endospore appendage [[Clostridium] dakarense]|nr:S-Ena type endospore appendage [[Clostridium] dakarense]
MYKSSNCGCSQRPEHDHKHDDKKEDICDIESKCCNGFVKEQFTIRSTATSTPLVVYDSTVPTATRATVKIRNLSSMVSIRVQSNGIDLIVAPNQEAAFTAAQLDTVVITTAPGSPLAATARVLLCFDLQVASLGPACCPAGTTLSCCPESD